MCTAWKLSGGAAEGIAGTWAINVVQHEVEPGKRGGCLQLVQQPLSICTPAMRRQAQSCILNSSSRCTWNQAAGRFSERTSDATGS